MEAKDAGEGKDAGDAKAAASTDAPAPGLGAAADDELARGAFTPPLHPSINRPKPTDQRTGRIGQVCE